MSISSIKTLMNKSKYYLNTLLIKSMKATEAFVILKDTYKFITTIPSLKGYLRNVIIPYSKLMIARSEVYLRKTTSTLKLVEQSINPRDRIFVLDCDFVQLTIVNAHYERTIFFFHEQ
ncbi:hypothetical protein R3W88_022670 [Solanum pinnatisectum]|uniref:Uncharacterized protein n=1 Tax=Solanum pinnatisectum TaxID=50273 RepID=A0AAV9LVB4_9SOLN|nr:hypothetical protein R3W88_022670 [Solanum pinnatisectum]